MQQGDLLIWIVIAKIRGMTDYRGFGFSESCLRILFLQDCVLDADDDFSCDNKDSFTCSLTL